MSVRLEHSSNISDFETQYDEKYKVYEKLNSFYESCEKEVREAYQQLTEDIEVGNAAAIFTTGDWYQGTSERLQKSYVALSDMGEVILKIRGLLLKQGALLNLKTLSHSEERADSQNLKDFVTMFDQLDQNFIEKKTKFTQCFEEYVKSHKATYERLNWYNNEGGWIWHGIGKGVMLFFDVQDALKTLNPPPAYKPPTNTFSAAELRRPDRLELPLYPVQSLSNKQSRTKNVITNTLK